MQTGDRVTYTYTYLASLANVPAEMRFAGVVGLVMKRICSVRWSDGRLSIERMANLRVRT